MELKKIIKYMLYPIQCLRFRIKNHDGFIYIGKQSKIVNPKNMYFGNNVSIMPYNMLVGLNDKYRLKIGKNVEIGMYSRIGCVNSIEIEDNVFTGPHVFIADYNHEYRNVDTPILYQGNFNQGGSKLGVTLGLVQML